jgi:malonyl CoA-acyl carrier protein transacylase
MAIVGGQVLIMGWNVSKEAEMHSVAIEELGESFGNEVQPVIMEFEGQQYVLTGTAEDQLKRWKELLRQIYFTETGFEPMP